MDVLRYSGGITFQGSQAAADLSLSVENLVYSIRQDLFHPQQTSSPMIGGQNSYADMSGYDRGQQSPFRQPTIENHHVIEQVTFKSAKSFYQEIYGQSESNNSVVSSDSTTRSNNTDGSIDTPRILPKPPLEPRNSKTRSSLRRAAKALLSRSRQNLSDSERRTHKPKKPEKPASEGGKLRRSGSIRDKLQRNKHKMGELLKTPTFLRRASQDNMRSESSEYDSYSVGGRRYASAENVNPIAMDDVDDTAPIPASQQHYMAVDSHFHGQRYSSVGNLTSNYHSTENLPLGYQSYDHLRLAHSSTSDLESQYSSSELRSYGSSRELPRSASPGYQLRRHSSGPVYNDSSLRKRDIVKRGYHTADSSDTDSSLSRNDGYMPHGSSRHDTTCRRPLPSTRDALRMLQKKRDGATTCQQRGLRMQSGPLRADHNIQTVRKEESSPMEQDQDSWLGQGARPKRTQSTESLETEAIRHDVLPDSIIRIDKELTIETKAEQSQDSRKDDSHMSNQDCPAARQRPPSPSRSVHFEEDPNSSPHQHYRRTSSCRTPSRSAVRSSASHRHYSRMNSDSSPYASSVTVEPHLNNDGAPAQNRNNSGFVNSVTDIELNHGNLYLAQNGCNISSNDQSSPGGGQRTQLRNQGNPEEIQDSVMDSRFEQADGFNPRGSTLMLQPPHHNRYESTENISDNSRPSLQDSRCAVGEPTYRKVSKSHHKRPLSQPLPSNHMTTSSLRPGGSGESHMLSGNNPCIVINDDDSIMPHRCEIEEKQKHPYVRSHFDNCSDISSSRFSISSRNSISEKVQSMGRATKQKFQNVRKAFSLDRVDKAGKSNECSSKVKKSPSMRSLTSILRKKNSKSDDSEEEYPSKLDTNRKSASVIGLYNRPHRSSLNTDVTSPSHGRRVGRLLSRDSDGSQVIELVKPPAGPFGFYIARGTYDFGSGIFVTRLGDGHPAKILAGLLGIGDEILEINGESVRTRPIDYVYDIMMDNNTLVLKVIPFMSRGQGH